jgi:hypothetical protein
MFRSSSNLSNFFWSFGSPTGSITSEMSASGMPGEQVKTTNRCSNPLVFLSFGGNSSVAVALKQNV